MAEEAPGEPRLLRATFAWPSFVHNAPGQFRMIATTETATVRSLMADQELEITDQWQTIEELEALDEIEGIGEDEMRPGDVFVANAPYIRRRKT